MWPDYTTRQLDRAGFVDGREIAQREWELANLLNIYHQLQPQVVVELGVYQGGTLHFWLQNAPPNATIIGIDCLPIDEHWRTWVPSGITLDYLQGDTHDPVTLTGLQEILRGRPIDFLFIDCDHTEEGVTRDFEMYGPLVRSGGVIAFHDILDPDPERQQDNIRVSRLWERIQRAGYFTRELVAHPEQDWGGIGVLVK